MPDAEDSVEQVFFQVFCTCGTFQQQTSAVTQPVRFGMHETCAVPPFTLIFN